MLLLRPRQPALGYGHRPLLPGHGGVPAQHVHRAFRHRSGSGYGIKPGVNQDAAAPALRLQSQAPLPADGKTTPHLNAQINRLRRRQGHMPDIARADFPLKTVAICALRLDLDGVRSGGGQPGNPKQRADVLQRIAVHQLHDRLRTGGGQGAQGRQCAHGDRP